MNAKRLKVAILDDYEGAMAAHPAVKAAADKVDLTTFDAPLGADAAFVLADFDGICLIRERMAFPASLLEQLPRLRFLAFTGARNPSCDVKAATARAIPVSNTPGGPSKASTAEQTWALLLAASKQLVPADTGMRAGHWRRDANNQPYPLPSMVEGERLGMVGLGSIGERVARVGLAFGMDVVAWSQNLTDERAAEVGVKRVDKAELFSTSRFISMHLVLSDRSRGIVGADEMKLMRPDSVIVNTSRAGLFDNKALIAGLKAGRPAYAAMDVHTSEPTAADDPFRELITLPNVTMSPHLAYVTERILDAFGTGLGEVISGWAAGKPVNVMNG
ncbi:MAG: D-2-hydroxyacid dehydrogenase family protein [Burkholderiaceae bacterium]